MNIIEIPLQDKPSHGSVKRVQNIETDFLLLKIGLNKFNVIVSQKKNEGFDLMSFLSNENQEVLFEFLTLQNSVGEYQTIMLASGWNLRKILAFEEEATEEEYQALLKRCIETLGGTAADFFHSWSTVSSSQAPEKEESQEL